MAKLSQRPQPNQTFGIALALYPSSQQVFDVELQRGYGTTATMVTIAKLGQLEGGGTLVYQDELPNTTGQTVYYRARHTRAGWNAGSWTVVVSGEAGPLGETPPDTPLEGSRRVDTLWETDGKMKSNVVQTDGVATLAIVKGYETGLVNGGELSTGTWVDGPSVDFVQTFNDSPEVRMYPGSGTVYTEPDPAAWTSSDAFASTLRQVVELSAVSVQTSGFTPRARLNQTGTALTGRAHGFSTDILSTVGATNEVTPANAPAYNDQYTINYSAAMDWATTSRAGLVTMTIAADRNTTGDFVEVDSNTHIHDYAPEESTAAANFTLQTFVMTVSGVVSTDEFRLRYKSLSLGGNMVDSAVQETITGSTSIGLTYQTSTATSLFAPMCPSTSDTVRWVAISRTA